MNMNKKTIKDVDLKGKKVFCRVDYNVPFDENMNITNDTRIQATVPTVTYLLEQGAAVILACHIGRPSEAREDKFSTKHILKRLSEVFKQDVKWAPDCVGPEAEKAAADLKPGEILLLENLRYHKEEKKNDPEFAKQLAALADIAVNDAFGVSHRAHAANVGITQYLESVAGFLMEKEINFIGKTLEAPQRPFVAIIGGAKVSDKIGVIENLLKIADKVIIGGGMSYTFSAAEGGKIGDSLLEADKIDLAKEFMAKGAGKLFLPVDTVEANAFDNATEIRTVKAGAVDDGFQGLDIGPESVELFKKELEGAKTVFWNGPMGVFEKPEYAKGTVAVCEAIANLEGATTIIGGGDSASAAKNLGFADKFSHISTGGGASLEFMEGKELPGVAIIPEK